MNDQYGWAGRDAADIVLAEFRQLIGEVTEQVHAASGDELKPVQNALKDVVWRMQAVEERMRARLRGGVALGVAAVPPGRHAAREVGQVTADQVRRMRLNRGTHGGKP